MARRIGVGRLYIRRMQPTIDPVSAEYQLTFGSGSEIALNLGRVRGLDALTDALRAGDVPVGEIERAWKALANETRYVVMRIRLTVDLLRMLGLS